jgi:pyruvate/2-oxoglutarate dehydrogenase complex dihydrolipoamide dehydrogenase (E3) component
MSPPPAHRQLPSVAEAAGGPAAPAADAFDFVIIGSGAAGEAALAEARRRGSSVAIVESELFGGSCAHWACMPSKALLHAAAVHVAGGDFPWQKASAFRDWMINREGLDEPDDSGHERDYLAQGAMPIRGHARIAGPGRVDVELRGGGARRLEARFILVAVGSNARIPALDGLDRIHAWTNREATGTRTLPESLLIMGGGPTGVELAQVYARYGVPVTIVDPNSRILSRDHPRNSAALTEALQREGATVRTGVRATHVEAGSHEGAPARVQLSDDSWVEGHAVLLAVGRAFPLDGLGLESVGVNAAGGRVTADGQLRIADGVYLIGDPAGPEMHTHVSHYEGEMAVRIALGEDVRPDFRAIPRATYTDPETASVGMLLEEAQAAGHDVVERTIDIGTSAKGYVSQSGGHITLVVDRRERVLRGAFIAGSGASELIHEAVLAIKLGVRLEVLADTIHAFPTTARVMGTLFGEVARELRAGAP